MTNLTVRERLLKEHPVMPLPGHAVVVFERVGLVGEKIHCVLVPGAAPPRFGFLQTLLGNAPSLIAFAVDTSPERYLSFAEPVTLTDRVHHFEVQFELWYRVADSARLASQRAADPLEMVRARVAEVITRQVATLPWGRVFDAFGEEGEQVVSRHLAELEAFATGCGLQIRALRIAERLHEGDVDIARVRADAVHRMAVRSIETDLEVDAIQARERVRLATDTSEMRINANQMEQRRAYAELIQADRSAQARLKAQDALASATIATISRVAQNISTSDGLVEGLRTVHTALGAAIGAPSQEVAVVMAAPAQGGLLPGAPAGALGALLRDVLVATQRIVVRTQKQALRAALLHLAAEMVADDAGSVRAQEELARRARAALDALDPAPAWDDLELLRSLVDPAALRSRLND